MENSERKKNNSNSKPFTFEYNKTLQAMICKVTDPEQMFPFYLEVENAGLYKINKNKTGKIQMSK